MTNITPKHLKKVAEYMGYKARLNSFCEWVFMLDEKHHKEIEYNPLQNSDQCLELVEKLKIWSRFMNNKWYAIVDFDLSDSEGKAETINEAVTLAAISYVEGLENA